MQLPLSRSHIFTALSLLPDTNFVEFLLKLIALTESSCPYIVLIRSQVDVFHIFIDSSPLPDANIFELWLNSIHVI